MVYGDGVGMFSGGGVQWWCMVMVYGGGVWWWCWCWYVVWQWCLVLVYGGGSECMVSVGVCVYAEFVSLYSILNGCRGIYLL